MKIRAFLASAGLVVLMSVAVWAAAENVASRPPAVLLVTILDENGSLCHCAHIYIFSKNKQEFIGTRESYGTTTFDLPAGEYRIYAAKTLTNHGIVDHYASPEANVRLTPDEPTSVILPIQLAPDSQMVLSDNARHKMDIDPELAKYLN